MMQQNLYVCRHHLSPYELYQSGCQMQNHPRMQACGVLLYFATLKEETIKVTDCYVLAHSRNPRLNKLHLRFACAAAFVRNLSKLRFLPHCSRIFAVSGYRPTSSTSQVAKCKSFSACKHATSFCIRQHFYSILTS